MISDIHVQNNKYNFYKFQSIYTIDRSDSNNIYIFFYIFFIHVWNKIVWQSNLKKMLKWANIIGMPFLTLWHHQFTCGKVHWLAISDIAWQQQFTSACQHCWRNLLFFYGRVICKNKLYNKLRIHCTTWKGNSWF